MTLARKLILLLCLLTFVTASTLSRDVDYDEKVHDFGSVGIGFKVKHNFYLFNQSEKPYRIDSFNVNCDCSRVHSDASVLNPGDTAFFELTFETTNYYGPTTKEFTVFTDYEILPAHKFFYKAMVEQWPRGMKPNPASLFFLPGQNAKKITIPNPAFDKVEIMKVDQFDESFEIDLIKDSAGKNENLELAISPSSKLKQGENFSNLTLTILINGNKEVPVHFTFPVKIVSY